ncbi:hypothetical protein [Roseinatronobacter alkalisoli]|uniref:Uncharacterized protein n=1 Tax=Roseinatronobacter alkalisoli TaxID=3028235 RepID=A0ABT5T8R6_9RHOB|nr:hypothetical protein [Roseinatronobacter sp. HJB301]MDD7971376.1 hypothetical protein [Roseinatronobacter sp. HJB301]
MRKTTALVAAIGLAVVSLPVRTQASDDWQLAHGGFVTASDVRPHNGLAQDRADILAALSGDTPDWAQALALYTWGANFPWRDMTHSLGRFADNYNGAMPAVLPLSVAHWGDGAFALAPVYSALAGTGAFSPLAPDARVAFIDGASLATILNWTRFELAMSERKALASEPNWALSNGSPKNWNEIFAFHWGPEGQHSVHAALEQVPDGAQVNAALYAALAEGQPQLLQERWAAAEAARVETLLHEGALRLFLAALMDADTASDDDSRTRAVMRARGLWLAAAEALLSVTPAEADGIEAALAGTGDADLLPFAVQAVADALAQLHG